MGLVADLGVDALTLGALYVLVVLGYVLVYSILRIFHLAHGDVVVLGGMVGIKTLELLKVGQPGALPAPLALLAAIVVAGTSGALVSWAIEAFVYRRIRTRSMLTPLLAALGLSLILQNLLMLATSKEPVLFPIAAIPQGFIEIGGVRILLVSIVVFGAAVALLALLGCFVRFSRIGVAMLAVAQDAEAAQMIGLPVHRITSVGFLVAGALAGSAGVLFGMYVGSLSWFMGASIGIRGFSAALIGGLTTISGGGIGAFILAFGEIFGVGIRVGNFQLDPSWREIVAFALVVVVLLFKPEGLFGARRRSWQVRN
jgi:branched-chain amino acid transport system permease protein